jgi:hypothetical protein
VIVSKHQILFGRWIILIQPNVGVNTLKVPRVSFMQKTHKRQLKKKEGEYTRFPSASIIS